MESRTSWRLAAIATAAAFLTGCSGPQSVDASHLTIVTTESALDTATSLALAQYVGQQGIDVQVQYESEQDTVFEILQAESTQEHPRIGLITATQDAASEDHTLQLPDTLDIVAQAPAAFGHVAAASPVTAQHFAREQLDVQDTATPLAAACAPHTWFLGQATSQDLVTISAALAANGCEPEFEQTQSLDVTEYEALVHRVLTEPDTALLVYGVDPVITDQGLATLDVGVDSWPHSNLVALAGQDLDDALATQVATVLDILDSDAATRLLRGYYNAQTSVSDLDYDVDEAMRHWLADGALLDADTVISITEDND